MEIMFYNLQKHYQHFELYKLLVFFGNSMNKFGQYRSIGSITNHAQEKNGKVP